MTTPIAAVDLQCPVEGGRYRLPASERNLLDLPPEVRNRIYRYVFEGACIRYDKRRSTSTSNGHEVLLTSKAFYQEAKGMFYKSATVRAEDRDSLFACGTVNSNILQHVEQVVVSTAGRNYHLPEVLQEMRSLKRIEIDHPEDWQEYCAVDGNRATDEELEDVFSAYFDVVPVHNTSALLRTLSARNVEICIPVMFWLPCRHGREIYCEFNASGGIRRIKEVKLPINDTKGCRCGICKTKALIWVMVRLRWISGINKRRRSLRLKGGDAAKAIFPVAEGR